MSVAPELPPDLQVLVTDPVLEIGPYGKKEEGMNDQTTTVTDPVCGMTVDPAKATSIEHERHVYFFCCKGCVKTFTKDPGAFLKAASAG